MNFIRMKDLIRNGGNVGINLINVVPFFVFSFEANENLVNKQRIPLTAFHQPDT